MVVSRPSWPAARSKARDARGTLQLPYGQTARRLRDLPTSRVVILDGLTDRQSWCHHCKAW